MKPSFPRVLVFALAAALAFAFAGLASAQDGELEYSVIVDVVRGSQNPTGPVCVLTPVFKTGEQVVWLAQVFDADTGEKLSPERAEELGMTVTAVLEDGSEYELEYGLHPREEPQIYLWAGAWVIPPVYPTGVLNFTVVVEDAEGNTVTWAPIGHDRPEYPSLIRVENR